MTTAQALATAAQQTADVLLDSARHHKRAAAFHRRGAQRAMQDLDRLRRACAEVGIQLVMAPGGADTHARNT